jgi:hypothetical protein
LNRGSCENLSEEGRKLYAKIATMLVLRRLLSLLLLVAGTEASFKVLKSRFDSNNAIRIKELPLDGDLCKTGRPSYSGWADIGPRHLFYCEFLGTD